jgi:DNA uptake protein ComE-like DNA-binding protein
LLQGVDSWFVRGEDWNLNGILDPNENDGNASDPPDNADGILDAGWSGIVTADSLDGGWAASGQARLNLTEASEADLVARTQMTSDQAKVVIDYVNLQTTATMADFLRRSLQQLSAQLNGGQTQGAPRIQALNDEQLTLLLAECEVNRDTSAPPLPGKLNINTCDSRIFEYLPTVDSTVAENIMAERDARRQGFVSLIELKAVPGMNNQTLAALYDLVDVRTNVFVVTSRGRDDATGIEVEITASIDRSSLPARLTSVIVK